MASSTTVPIRNPIIPGFNPDPSCICVDGTFYLVCSSFLFFPGIPVYTSKDLQNWTQIGNVITRPSQLDYSECRVRPGTQFTGGIWAPTIRFHKETFYVITTSVQTHKDWDDDSRWHNVIYSCSDPHESSWSDPVRFEYPGYDTSLFWDDDGKAYMVGSFYWRIRPEISQFEIDLKTGKSLSGEPRKLWSGTGGLAPEAPHMYKKGDKYYLIVAEGLTEFGHCATMASAPSVWGPFTPCPANPVLGAASPTSLFQTVGHADLFAGPGAGVDAEWWAVCLASRVVGEGRPIGRESVLLRVDWAGEWPVVDLSAIDVPVSTLTEAPVRPGPWMDVLEEPRHRLLHLRVPPAGAVRFEGDALLLCPPRGVPVPLTAPFGAPAFCGVRQTDLHFECRVELALRGAAQGAGVEAGIVVYLDPERHLAIGTDGQGFVFTRVQPGAEPDAPRVTHERAPLPSAQPRLALRVRGTPERYVLEYAETGTLDDDDAWKALGEGKTSEVSGGFTGVILALYAVQGQDEFQKDSGLEVQVSRWLYRTMV